ncbi:hypothetical protein BN2537_16865 [Streptomyces venezuelae]|nr:hypothetical protein BN2537_16865 [Streptomyces venezuelae]
MSTRGEAVRRAEAPVQRETAASRYPGQLVGADVLHESLPQHPASPRHGGQVCPALRLRERAPTASQHGGSGPARRR